MVRFVLLEKDADVQSLAPLQSLLDDRVRSSRNPAWARLPKEIAWVQPGHFYVLAMDGSIPLGFVFGVKAQDHLSVDAYYTHSAHRSQRVATRLTYYLLALARKRGLKSVYIPNALDPVIQFAKKMQSNPRWVGKGKGGIGSSPPERFLISNGTVRITLAPRKEIRKMTKRRH